MDLGFFFFFLVIHSFSKRTNVKMNKTWSLLKLEQNYQSRTFKQLILIWQINMCKEEQEQSSIRAQQRVKLVLICKGKLQRSSKYWVWPYKMRQVSWGKAVGDLCVSVHILIHICMHGHTNTNAYICSPVFKHVPKTASWLI